MPPRPTTRNTRLALAQALAEAGDESPEALDVYLVAVGTMDYGRGRIAFRTGNILRARGEAEQALRYYKIAAKDGCPDPALFLALADLFQDAGQFSEKTLPAFEAVRELRWSDPRFMEGLCRCYDAARRHDEEPCRAAEKLLELDSGNAAGLRLLAKCLLQTGDAGRGRNWRRAPARPCRTTRRRRRCSPRRCSPADGATRRRRQSTAGRWRPTPTSLPCCGLLRCRFLQQASRWTMPTLRCCGAPAPPTITTLNC